MTRALPQAVVEAMDHALRASYRAGMMGASVPAVDRDQARTALVVAIATAIDAAGQNAAHAAVYATFDVLRRSDEP